jgi:hypothetical protein
MSQLARELKPPNAGPQWVPAGGPVSVQAKFGSDEFALVVAVRVGAQGGAPQIPNTVLAVPLQTIQVRNAWTPLTAPEPAASDTHWLVMGCMRVRPVRGGNKRHFDAPWHMPGMPPIPLDATALQDAIDQWHAQQPDELARCLLALPAPTTNRSANSACETTAFALASCQYPAGLLDRPLAGASFDRLERALAAPSTQPPIAALLLLGDQIYADATYGILDPARQEDRYGEAYRAYDNALRTRIHLSQLANSGRLCVTPDDHEFSDNWEPGPGAAAKTALKDGLAAFDAQRAGPLPLRQASGGYWGPVDVGGGHEVFMLDARTTRDPRPWGPGKSSVGAHILSAVQRGALQDWLLQRQQSDSTGSPVVPKFISSSVWLLPRLVGRDGAPGEASALSDAWDGYPKSLHWLLSFIAEKNIRGVVVLCGDGHLAGHTVVELTPHQQPAMEVHVLHTPALYAPFPFANAQPHEYASWERFSWGAANDQVECEVNASLWPMGDGFVQVAVQRRKAVWEICATFNTSHQLRCECWTVG